MSNTFVRVLITISAVFGIGGAIGSWATGTRVHPALLIIVYLALLVFVYIPLKEDL